MFQLKKSKEKQMAIPVDKIDSEASASGDENQSNDLEQKRYPTVISEGSSMEGSLNFSGSVHLDGKFIGNIKADLVNVGMSGFFDGLILTEHLSISGSVSGEVQCQKLIVKAGAVVSAKIQYNNIEIQLGAIVNGELKRLIA